jgi:cytochrome c biogenesis protein CcdA
MIRPQRQKPSANNFSKFVNIFGMLMTFLYIGLGLLLIFVDAETMNLNMSKDLKYILGGVLILYGLIRFVKVYQNITKKERRRYEE